MAHHAAATRRSPVLNVAGGRLAGHPKRRATMSHAGRRTFASTLTVCATLFAAVTAQAQNPPTSPATPPEPAAMQTPAPSTDPAAQSTPPAAQAPAPAQDPADAVLRRMDRDGNGQVSADEHAADAKARFDAMDADRNYNVSAEEAADAKEGDAASADNGAMGAAPDPNNNGELSRSEADANAERDFRALDANRDGTLDVEELKRASKP